MAENDDSRPFVVLKQNAEDFQTGFASDIDSCLNLLHDKLSTLIRDPDCVHSPSKEAKRLSAHLEFTKAKYEIFINAKSVMDSLEKSWIEQIGDMKYSFLENVEILLASMKLSEPDRENSAKSRNIRKSFSSSTRSPSVNSFCLLDTAKKIPVLNSLLPKDAKEVPTNDTIMPSPQVNARQSRRTAVQTLAVNENAVVSTPLRKSVIKGRKSILKPESSNESELHATPSRSTRKRAAVKETIINKDTVLESEEEITENDIEFVQDLPKTPKNVHFSVGLDLNEDLEIYSPEVNLTRSAPKRKTVVAKNLDSFSDINLTPSWPRKSKRKTICGSVMDVTAAAPSPKRLKRGGRSNNTPAITEEPEKPNLLDSGESAGSEHYSPWLLLEDLDGKIPSQPGVYELKVYKAKKSAYVGSCDNLLQKLTLHKVGQNSGHKHLDKFLERNRKDVQVRFEKLNSAAQAKKEEMQRIKAFVEQHKTTPAYN